MFGEVGCCSTLARSPANFNQSWENEPAMLVSLPVAEESRRKADAMAKKDPLLCRSYLSQHKAMTV
jgi:hypothetical protein